MCTSPSCAGGPWRSPRRRWPRCRAEARAHPPPAAYTAAHKPRPRRGQGALEMRMIWLRLKTAVVCLFGALLGGGAVLSALQCLFVGQVFCLVCRRGAPAVPWHRAPGLFMLNGLRLLGLGVILLLGVWFGVQRLLTATTPVALEPPIPARRPPRPGSLRARTHPLGRRLLLALAWALVALAAFIVWVIRTTPGAGVGWLGLVAG